jgi:hypothetical protein
MQSNYSEVLSFIEEAIFFDDDSIINDYARQNHFGRQRLEQIWFVNYAQGIFIRKHNDVESPPIGVLPFGAIMVVSHLNSRVSSMHISYPYDGWIVLQNTSLFSVLSKVKILDDKKLKSFSQHCHPAKVIPYVDYVGGDLINVPIQSESIWDCCRACFDQHFCVSYTFSQDGSCRLKNSNARSKKVPQPIFSGYIEKTHIHNAMAWNKVLCCGKIPRHEPLQYDSTLSAHEVTLSKEWAGQGLPHSLHSRSRSSPFVLHITRNSFDWLQQWPIGTGRFGGMVGGTIEEEIIPLSIADYYVLKKLEVQEEDDKKTKERIDAFYKARESLRKVKRASQISDAGKYVPAMRQPHGLGMFQYIGDLTLFFSPSALSFKPQKELEMALREPKKPARRGRDHARDSSMREEVINRLRVSFVGYGAGKPNDEPRFGNIYLNHGTLDMRHGISHSFFVDEVSARRGGTGSHYRVHHREWFASGEDEVLVGRFSCQTAYPSSASTW